MAFFLFFRIIVKKLIMNLTPHTQKKIAALRRKLAVACAVLFLFLKSQIELNSAIGVFLSIVLILLGITILLLPIIIKLLGEEVFIEHKDDKNEIPLDLEHLIDQIGDNEQARHEKHKLILEKKMENAANDAQKVKVKLKKKYNMASSKGHSPF